jgi:hypothetical protein
MVSKPQGTFQMRRLAEVPMVVMAIGVFVLLVRTVAPRVWYPYDLEWMEGGMLAHSARVADGLPLYVQPEAGFIPFIYPPLYPWLMGLLSGCGLPIGYPMGRLISLVGVAAAALALVLAVRREGGGWSLGVGGAALFLSTYDSSGAFFDLVRNDGVQIGLLAMALLSVRTGWLRAGGLLLTAAFLTKHTAALYGIPALWWLFQHEGAQAAKRFCMYSVVPALGITLGLALASDGLFLTYVLEVPAAHPFIFERFIWTAPKELVMALPWTAALVLFVAFAARRATGRGARFWLAQGALALVLSAIMRGHHGGFLNVLIPGLWVGGLWAALAVNHLRTRWPSAWVALATSALVAWQLWAGRWNPVTYIPTAADRAAGDRVVEQLRAIEGPILAPWQPWMPVQAGKAPSVALIALWDIDHAGGPLHKAAGVIAQSISDQRWGAVLTARAKFKYGLREHYEKTDFDRPRGKALYPKTGWRVRPHALWVRADSGAAK